MFLYVVPAEQGLVGVVFYLPIFRAEGHGL